MKWTSIPARRPSAGAVPGRWGACLAVRTPPAAFVLIPELRQTHGLTVVAAAQVLECPVINRLAQEPYRPVRKGEGRPARVSGFEALGHVEVEVVPVGRGGAAV